MSQVIHEDLRELIEAADDKFMALYRQGDTAGLAEMYTEDAILMPPNADLIQGKAGIQQAFAGLMAMGVKALVFDIVGVEHCGELAVETARFKALAEGDQFIDHGKYVVVWRHEHGQWKLYRDIFNFSSPAK